PERHRSSDPPSAEELAACAAAVRSLLAERLPDGVDVQRAIGVAGSITTIAALDLGLFVYDRFRIHGHRLRPEDVRRQLDRLPALPLEQRRAVPAPEPERPPVLRRGGVGPHETPVHTGMDRPDLTGPG